jgi:diaminopimelate epimerase
MGNGSRFYKMSGSGNDFIFFDQADNPSEGRRDPAAIKAMCAHGTGIGADGVVFFDRSADRAVSINYYNSDGSGGELCGNATLCTVRLSEMLGSDLKHGLTIQTDAGTVQGRLVDGLPEIDIAPVSEVSAEWAEIPTIADENRLGFAVVGVPHVIIEVPDVQKVDVRGRGSAVRRDRSLSHGANVNFVSPAADGRWMIRTYERGVEGETLACGTGAVASAILLTAWAAARPPVRMVTRSGRELTVTLRRDGGLWHPSLRGAAELVFTGFLPDGLGETAVQP